MAGSKHYTIKGLYNAYKKNNKERAELDYYATPPEEVENILDVLNYDFHNQTILEPCVGGGHMVKGIDAYLMKNYMDARCIGSDIQDREYRNHNWSLTYGLDFLGDDYPFNEADVIIMNPPYSTLEPFLIRALEIAKKKLIVLCRTQALEGVGRYNNIFMSNPPSSIYQYVDRIKCEKNGIPTAESSAQAYCWIIWDREKENKETSFHWILRR